MEDFEIVKLFLNRDEKAISQCSKKYGRGLCNIANAILEDVEAAKECENDTYLKAWNSIPPHTPYNYLFSYLAQIARRLAIDSYRRCHAKRREGIVMELSYELEQCLTDTKATLQVASPIEEQMFSKELMAEISGFLKNLPKEQRHIFLGRYWYAKSISELSDIFGYSQSKIKSILFRTRKKLNEFLIEKGYGV